MIKVGFHTYQPEDIDCYTGVQLTIGNWCSIGSGLKIYSGVHACNTHPNVVSTYAFKEDLDWDYPKCFYDGFVTVGNDVWIATNVSILEGVIIGDGAIIGAGSVVTKDVPAYAFVAGNPARVKYRRFTDKQIEKLLKIKWWDWEVEDIKDSIADMKDIDTFIREYG